jgi:hypothetical protein
MTTTNQLTEWREALEELERSAGLLLLSPLGGGPATEEEEATALRRMTPKEFGERSHCTQGPNIDSWRVRIFEVSDDSIIVEHPYLANRPVPVRKGDFVMALAHRGNSRWSLRCPVLDLVEYTLNKTHSVDALQLGWPDEIHNAQRRDFFRVEASGQPTPTAEVCPVFKTSTCVNYETYCQQMHKRKLRDEPPEEPALPDIGQSFHGRVVDVSGGGMCIAVPRNVIPLLKVMPLLWLRVNLPEVREPVYVVAQLAHYHIDDRGMVNLGLCFVFDHHRGHRKFISDVMCRFAADLQRSKLKQGR